MVMVRNEQAEWHTLNELIDWAADQHGDKLALNVEGQSVTHKAWRKRSLAIAAGLYAQGVRKGDVVASFMYNRLEQALLWFAANRIGAVWSPINCALVGDDFAYTLADTGAKIVVVDPELTSVVDSLPEDLRDGLDLYVLGQAPDGYDSFDALELTGRTPPEIDVALSDASTIIYTGGTTGRPKGVVLPHFAYIVSGYRYRWNLSVTENDVYYTVMQMFHIGAQDGAVMCSLMWGATGHIDRKFSTSSFFRRTRETGATIIDPVGTMVLFLLNLPPSEEDQNHSIRISMDSTGQIAGNVAEEFGKRFGIQMCATYAQSENGGGYLITSPPGPDYKPRTLGKTWGWAEAAIVNGNDEILPPNEIGEIVLRPVIPYSFMLGYHNQPEKTQETMKNCWLHTGDLGRVDEQGFFWFEGRKAHWLRRRGENISAIEVEEKIIEHDDVREVCVVGVPSEYGEEEVKAFIVQNDGANISPTDLCEFLKGKIAAFKIPRFVECVDDFPRSVTKNEIQRHIIKSWPNDKAWDREKSTA